ncbi:MFS transporter [Allosaccharopolyspora coralli]|nr:MFS transporter [Allosaccharopolyspora coralli]
MTLAPQEQAHHVGVRTRSFRGLLVSWALTSMGDGVRTAALPLYAAVSTRDPLAVSAVAVAEVLPWLLVALPAGALVDRCEPKWTVLWAHVFRFVLTLVLAASIVTGTDVLWVLVASAFLLTCAETFADSASQSMLVSYAGSDDLERANGRFVGVETTGIQIAGPLAAAALFAWEPAACFATISLAFILAALRVCVLPRVRDSGGKTGAADGGQSRTTLRSEVLSGLRFLLGEPALRTVVGVVGMTALLISAVNAIAVLYAIEVLELPAAAVPTLLVCTAVGTILAAQVVPWCAERAATGHVMIGCLSLLALGIALFGLAPVPVVAWIAYFVMGVGAGGWNVLSATKRQRLTPAPMMGRVTSAHRVLAWGLMPLGAAVAGPLATFTSLGTVLLTAAALVGVVVAFSARRLTAL